MGALIDSSVLIAAERGRLDLAQLLSSPEDEPAISAVTLSELLHGLHRVVSPAQRETRQSFLDGALARIRVIPFDERIARVHAAVWAGMAAKGVNIGQHDLLIGCTALALDFRVVTRDGRSFPRIPGLVVERV